MEENQSPVNKQEFYLLIGKLAAEFELKFGKPVMETIKENSIKHYGTFDEGDIGKYNLHQYEKLAQDRAKEQGVEIGYRREELLDRLKANPDRNPVDIITSMLAEDYGLQARGDSQQQSKGTADSTIKADDLVKMLFKQSPLLAIFFMLMKGFNENKTVNQKVKDNLDFESVVHAFSKKEEESQSTTVDRRTIPESQLKEFHEMGKSLREKGSTMFDMLYDNIKEQERQQDRSQGTGMGMA